MNENRISDYVLIFMKNLNLFIITYISMFMFHSLSGYINEGSAREILADIDVLPLAGWMIPILSVGMYVCCVLLMYIHDAKGITLFLKVLSEIGVGLVISFVLGFSYTGIFLLILADTMSFFPKSRWKFPIAVGICMLYLVIDADIISSYYNLIPSSVYLQYYQSNVRLVLVGIMNVTSSLNMLIFLVYIILLVRIQMSEKERVLELNEQLNMVNNQLQEVNIQLEKYAKESEKMAETRERNRLAREIHDTLGHALTGIITGLEACIAIMDVAPEATKVQLKAISDVARQGITDVRRSVKALRPDALEKLNLEDALKHTIEEMRMATSARIEYHCTAELKGFSEDEEEVIYRIVQECITNSIRHGHADKIQVDINREYNMLKICIADNGIGCGEVKKGFGLHHMEERLNMLQGNLDYKSENGFTVKASIPIRWGQEEQKK